MSYFPYCVKCLKQPDQKTKEFYDYRFEVPVCLECVENHNLKPEENEMPNGLTDKEALDRVAEILRVEQWTPETLGLVADIVVATDRVTWVEDGE
jgi:hypothetical protein